MRASRPPSIVATVSRPAVTIVTSPDPVSSESQRAAMRTPLPDISATDPSGFQITTSARVPERATTSSTPSEPMPVSTSHSLRARSEVSSPASSRSTTR